MDNNEKTMERTNAKYMALLTEISNLEGRQNWAGLLCIFLNCLIVIFSTQFVLLIIEKGLNHISQIELGSVLFVPVMGIGVCFYWSAYLTRLQLKLKVHYFQARYLERKTSIAGECFISDQSKFFNPTIHELQSPDGKELLIYPATGPNRMDGFIAGTRPSLFSLIMPALFTIIYILLIIGMVIELASI